jgi:hypothetical protein
MLAGATPNKLAPLPRFQPQALFCRLAHGWRTGHDEQHRVGKIHHAIERWVRRQPAFCEQEVEHALLHCRPALPAQPRPNPLRGDEGLRDLLLGAEDMGRMKVRQSATGPYLKQYSPCAIFTATRRMRSISGLNHTRPSLPGTSELMMRSSRRGVATSARSTVPPVSNAALSRGFAVTCAKTIARCVARRACGDRPQVRGPRFTHKRLRRYMISRFGDLATINAGDSLWTLQLAAAGMPEWEAKLHGGEQLDLA